jgi:hypothetical protein
MRVDLLLLLRKNEQKHSNIGQERYDTARHTTMKVPPGVNVDVRGRGIPDEERAR